MASSVVVSSSSRSRSALESFFTPSSVAVIGATEREGSVGRTILENLIHSSYRGQIFPVNPKRSDLLGIKCYPGVSALSEPVDLAVIVTPAATVPGVVRECVDAGTRSAIVISAGFKERGAEGVELERLVQAELRRGSMRLVGPNCLGMMNPAIGLNATFAHALARSEPKWRTVNRRSGLELAGTSGLQRHRVHRFDARCELGRFDFLLW